MQKQHGSKTKILDAAHSVIRAKGYAATTIDDLCNQADLTKGSFFHHFKGKEDLAVAAAQHWSSKTGRFFATAPYTLHADPLDRLLGYIDFRKSIIMGEVPQFTCFVGTMVQEVYQSNPAIRDACDHSIREHATRVEADIELAMETHQHALGFTAKSLALYTQAVIQGAFVLAKAENSQDVAKDCFDHLRRYVELLFSQLNPSGEHS